MSVNASQPPTAERSSPRGRPVYPPWLKFILIPLMVPLFVFHFVMNGVRDGRLVHIGLSLLLTLVSLGGKAKERRMALLYVGAAVLNCLNWWLAGKLGWMLEHSSGRRK
jgi:hypothetical protein